MAWLIELFRHELLVFALVLARVSGLVLAAPLFSSRLIPVRLRIALALCLAAVISPLHWQSSLLANSQPVEFLLSAACELALGLLLGISVALLLMAARMAGELASSLTALSFTQEFDEQGQSLPSLARLLDLATTGIFLAIGGHRLIVAAMLDTFQWLPPGTARPGGAWLEGLTNVATQSMSVGLRMAAPLIVSLLLAHLAIAFVSRTIPQLNAMGVGFSLNVLVALATLSLSLGTAIWVFQDQLEVVISTVHTSLARMPSRVMLDV
jgi:flagellar biosynthesis protein FliR